MALVEAPVRRASRGRPWLLRIARPLRLLLVAAAAWSLSLEAGLAQNRSRSGGEPAPADAPVLWLHSDGAGYSRIVLETADRMHVSEWRTTETLSERTLHDVRAAVDKLAPRSRAVALKARADVKFVTVKGVLLAVGAKEPAGYRAYLEELAQFPVRILGPRR